jgi:two-component system chemotaxis sensor kinase CheA
MLMDKQKPVQQLMNDFLEELCECVGDMHRHLLSLAQHPEPPVQAMLINELYRAAHKMKGAAIAARVPAVEKLCRQMQEILNNVRDGQRMMDDGLHTQFMNAVIWLRAAETLLRDGGVPESGDAVFE